MCIPHQLRADLMRWPGEIYGHATVVLTQAVSTSRRPSMINERPSPKRFKICALPSVFICQDVPRPWIT